MNFSIKVLVSHKTHFSHRGGSVTARPEIVFHAFTISGELFRLGECELCNRLAWLLKSIQLPCRRPDSRNCLLLPSTTSTRSRFMSIGTLNIRHSIQQSTHNSGIQPSSATIFGKLVSYVQHFRYPLTTFLYRLQISSTHSRSTFTIVHFVTF